MAASHFRIATKTEFERTKNVLKFLKLADIVMKRNSSFSRYDSAKFMPFSHLQILYKNVLQVFRFY